VRTRMWLPIALFLAGVFTIGYAVATGEADVSLIIIFPVFSGSSGLFLLGILLLVASFFVGFALLAFAQPSEPEVRGTTSVNEPSRTKSSYGGVVLIGPIPIAFGSDKSIAKLMLAIGIILAVIFIGALLLLS
jgi:uncharacterized protein (TIGR00304 family)